MTVFEITGNDISGGKDSDHNEALLKRVKDLEEFSTAIGKSLGMATIDSGIVTTEKDAYGFRFASTSEEKFDACGIESEGKQLPSEILAKL